MDYDTGQPSPPGVRSSALPKSDENKINTPPRTSFSSMLPTPKGVENAKKRLRAFSIQKKTPISPIVAPKPTGSGNTMVLIGKLSGAKPTPKREEDPDPKVPKLPKPPKPGSERKAWQDTYSELQRRTQAEIEDMKRKMELVDLGIPLGLICPSSSSDTAMPTKAMPPIKSFIDPSKVDELIREAKKAKMEGKPFKFDYRKLLPDYDNPFQRKKDEKGREEKDKKHNRRKSEFRDKKDKYGSRRYSESRKESRMKEHSKDRKQRVSEVKETKKVEVNTKEDDQFGDFVVCDSWSLDNEDTNISSPKTDKSDSQSSVPEKKNYKEPSELLKVSAAKKNEIIKSVTTDHKRVQTKIQPFVSTFKYECENNEEVLDIFDAESKIDKFATVQSTKLSLYDSPNEKSIDLDDSSRDLSLDDTFLESVINEIKVEEVNEDDGRDKGLVEYESPNNDDASNTSVTESVTPDLARKGTKPECSDGCRSSESGYKTSDTLESHKAGAQFRLSAEKELDDALRADKMSEVTLDSLEAWTFVLKICQPLLFRHDRKKCYKETRSAPKLWYSTNPKVCACVKDRSVVYEELEDNKMNLVDRVYGCDQISEGTPPKGRNWYPSTNACFVESRVQLSSEWEADDSQQSAREERRSLTPKTQELDLDREYHRFMEAVWPDAPETQKETSGSTTPVQESRKKRKEDVDTREEDKKTKKMKLSSEGWSQESEVEEDDRSKKKSEKGKSRKRKHSSSTSSSSDSEEDSKRKKKALKKKAMKKAKSKSAKRRRMGRRLLKKLTEKQKKSKKLKSDEDSESDISKKSKRKKLEKAKKRDKKRKKTKRVSSSSSSSSTDSESERNKSKTTKEKERKRRDAPTDAQAEAALDADVSSDIKAEKTTDDEGSKAMEFSPRRQKPREIIDVKELQNDFVGNTHVKEELEESGERESAEEEERGERPARIETLVRARGEITCDWRAGRAPAGPRPPSRWGGRWGERPPANILLTPAAYDEAYLDTYGAADRLQYGDCFAPAPAPAPAADRRATLDDRISQALRETVLGDVAEELPGDEPKDTGEPRPSKRVRFADGYAPGQDSDAEPPPGRKRRVRRVGCAWPCPSTHPDHVSLWDALPPPPPPPGDPPLRGPRPREPFAGVGLPVGGFMPPEPPPGLIALH